MRKLKKSDWIAIAGAILFVNVLTLWCVDISVSALINNGILTNGFFLNDPARAYHIGLYTNGLLNFLIFMIVVHIIMKGEESNE